MTDEENNTEQENSNKENEFLKVNLIDTEDWEKVNIEVSDGLNNANALSMILSLLQNSLRLWKMELKRQQWDSFDEKQFEEQAIEMLKWVLPTN